MTWPLNTHFLVSLTWTLELYWCLYQCNHSIGNWAQTYKLTTLPQQYPTWISKGRPSITMFFGIPGMCFKISTGVVWWLFVCLFLEFYWTHWAIYVQKNWNLFSVNVAMATTGIYQLSRKIRLDFCFYLGLIFIKKFLYSVHYSSSCPACSLFVHQAPKSSLLQWKDIHKSLCCCCVISAGIKPKSLYCSEGSSRSCEVFLGSKVADEFWRAILWPIQFSFSLLSSSAQFFVFSKYHLGLHLTHVPSYVHVDFNVVFRCPS